MSISTSSSFEHKGPDRLCGQGIAAECGDPFVNFIQENQLFSDETNSETEELALPIIRSLSQPQPIPPKQKQKFVPEEFRSPRKEPANKLCDAFPLRLPTPSVGNNAKLKSDEKTNSKTYVFKEPLALKAQKFVCEEGSSDETCPGEFLPGELSLLFLENNVKSKTVSLPLKLYEQSALEEYLPSKPLAISKEAMKKRNDIQKEFYWHLDDQQDLQKMKRKLEKHVKNLNNPIYQKVYLECDELENTGKLNKPVYLEACQQYLRMAACGKLDDPDYRQAYRQYLNLLIAGKLKDPNHLENYKNYLVFLEKGELKNPVFRKAFEEFLRLLINGKLKDPINWLAYENYLELARNGELNNSDYLQAYQKYLNLLFAGKLEDPDYRQAYQVYLKMLVAGKLKDPAHLHAHQKHLDFFADAQSEKASRQNANARESRRDTTSIRQRNPCARISPFPAEAAAPLRSRSKSRENMREKIANPQASSPRSPRDLTSQRQRRPSKENIPGGEPIPDKPGAKRSHLG